MLCKFVAPITVKVFCLAGFELCLHLQTIGCHPVKGAQHAVKTGEDAQVLLYVVVLSVGEDIGCYVLVLDALIGQYRWGQIAVQIHLLQPLYIQCGNPVVALPKLLQFLRGFALQLTAKLLCLLQKSRQIADRQAVRVHVHLFCG